MTKINANNFTTESQLSTRYNNEIAQFWLQGEFSSFNGVNDKRINYAIFNHKETDVKPANLTNRKCLIISSGRSEGYLKYKELAFDLFSLGFNVFLIDHRGQGISERLIENPHKGYVEDFQYYVDDFANFIEKAVSPYCNVNNESEKPYLLAHSMGAAIAARYLQNYPNTIQAAVLSSPMFGFNSGSIPRVIAESLVKVANQINQLVSDTPWYFLGQKDYTPKADDPTAFTDNPLMHSTLRFQQFIQLYQTEPQLQLGGITVKWLSESITGLEVLFNNIDKLTTPTLVIQAGADTIVSNEAQHDFCQQLHQHFPYSCPGGKPLVIEDAYHELFFESDIHRDKALTAAVDWFKQH